MTGEDFYGYVGARAVPGRRMYLFFDEVRHVAGRESAVSAMRADSDRDIHVTGSNACLLSSEHSTLLSGRCA